MWKGLPLASTDHSILRLADGDDDPAAALFDGDRAVEPASRAPVETVDTVLGKVEIGTHIFVRCRERLGYHHLRSRPGLTPDDRVLHWLQEHLAGAVIAGRRHDGEHRQVVRNGSPARYLVAGDWVFVVKGIDRQKMVTAYTMTPSEMARDFRLHPPAGTPAPALLVDRPAAAAAPLLSNPTDHPIETTMTAIEPTRTSKSQETFKPELHICFDSGNASLARDFSENERAQDNVRSIMQFLDMRSAEWRGLEYSGGPQVPVDNINVVAHQHRVKVRTGRFVGTFVNATHRDGHTMDHREIINSWNLKEFQEIREGRRQFAPSARACAPKINGHGNGHGNSEPRPFAPNMAEEFIANTDTMTLFLRSCYMERTQDDTISSQQMTTILDGVEPGLAEAILPKVLNRAQKLGWLASLDDQNHLFGFENVGLATLGVDPVGSSASWTITAARAADTAQPSGVAASIPEPSREESVPAVSDLDLLGDSPVPAPSLPTTPKGPAQRPANWPAPASGAAMLPLKAATPTIAGAARPPSPVLPFPAPAPAPALTPVPPPAAVAATPSPVVHTGLESLLHDAGAKLSQRDAALARRTQIKAGIAAAEAEERLARARRGELETQLAQVDAEIKRSDAIEKAMEALRLATEAA